MAPPKRKPEAQHPIQPVVWDKDVIRFKGNKIIQWLCDAGKLNLNEIAMISFPREDREQLAQLLGYSVSGATSLSYFSDEVWEKANEQSELLYAEKEGKDVELPSE